jgi:hypothetical protein
MKERERKERREGGKEGEGGGREDLVLLLVPEKDLQYSCRRGAGGILCSHVEL